MLKTQILEILQNVGKCRNKKHLIMKKAERKWSFCRKVQNILNTGLILQKFNSFVSKCPTMIGMTQQLVILFPYSATGHLILPSPKVKSNKEELQTLEIWTKIFEGWGIPLNTQWHEHELHVWDVGRELGSITLAAHHPHPHPRSKQDTRSFPANI